MQSAKRTSEILSDLANSCSDDGKITIHEFTEKLSSRAFGILIFIFAIIGGLVPGVSVIFALPIIIISVQIILGQHAIWLPKFIANKSLSERLLKKALNKTVPILKFLEKFIRPRLVPLTGHIAKKFVALILIVLSLIMLMPLPGFNIPPAICLCILALGLLEKDGVLILIGSIISITGICLMSFLISKGAMALYNQITNLLT